MNAWRDNRRLTALVISTVAAMALAWLVYGFIGHGIIDRAYRGEGFGWLDRLFRDRATRPVESYFERVDALLVMVTGYMMIAVATMGSLLIKPRNETSLRIWFVVVTMALAVTMSTATPRFLGDGPEYLLMTESLADHASPGLRDSDIERLNHLEETFGFSYSRRDPRQYYFESAGGNWYSYHFWLYPAVNLPVKWVLRWTHRNEGRVFQITNVILLAVALFMVIYRAKLDLTQRWLFALLLVFCPAFWFVCWPHPEVFSFALVTIAAVEMTRARWGRAILWAAVASTQNQPLVFLVLFLWLCGLIASPRRSRDIVVFSLAALPVLLPNAFFYAHFQVGSLLAREAASFSNVSVGKAFELFFDPNIGMLPYLPIAVAAFVLLLARDVLVVRRVTTSVQIAAVLFIMALACTPTYLWNHGTTGPSRYVVWMLPLVFYVLVDAVATVGSLRRPLAIVLGVAAALQAAMVVAVGGFTPPLTQMTHTYMARFVLDHAPAMYNPTYEIFAVRTSHRMPEITYTREGGYRAELPPTPIVYRSDNRCRKALLRGGEAVQLEEQCGPPPRGASRSGTDGAPGYVNY